MSGIIGFDKGDKGIISGGDLDYYRGKENRKDRIAIVWLFQDDDGNYLMGDDDTPQFLAEEIHYIDGKGYILDNEYLRDKLGPPKTKIGTFVVQYGTDRNGKMKEPFEYTVKPWTFGEDKFRDLKDIHQDFPLVKHDIKVVCKGEQYQKLNFTPTPQEAVWRRNDSIKKDILETVKKLQKRLSIGREVPIDELKDHFGDSVDVSPDASAEVDFDSLIDGIE